MITRVTIVKDKFTQQPKGMAYVQFDSEHSVSLSKALDQTNFFGRPITVMPKNKEEWTPAQAQVYAAMTAKPAQALHFPGGSWNRTWVANAGKK